MGPEDKTHENSSGEVINTRYTVMDMVIDVCEVEWTYFPPFCFRI